MIWLAADSSWPATWSQVATFAIIVFGVVGLHYVWARYGGGVDERAKARASAGRRSSLPGEPSTDYKPE